MIHPEPHLLLPRVFTRPLSADFGSLADRYLPAIELAWRVAFGHWLDPWQVWLIRSIFELYPEGHPRAGTLRFRQAVVLIPRQQGKTEVAAVVGLIGLLRERDAQVIGVASSIEQAGLIYRRTMDAIQRNKALRARFRAATETRGIRGLDGQTYYVKPSKSAALQGIPISTGLVDELHLLLLSVWSDLLSGTGGRPDTIIVGISTAGDADSEALLHLIGLGTAAAEGTGDERFGFWWWGVVVDTVPADDGQLLELLYASNPSLAAGRLDAEAVLSDVRSLPDIDILRYRLNVQRKTTEASFIPLDKWLACAAPDGYTFPADGPLVFTMDRTPEWYWATVTAHRRTADGVIHTAAVASIPQPTVESLVHIAERLYAHGPATYAMDGLALRAVGVELKRRGYPVYIGSHADAVSSAQLLFAKIAQRKLVHAGDELLARQIPVTKRKSVGESFRISRTSSSVEIDAVLATALGVLVADQITDTPTQVF